MKHLAILVAVGVCASLAALLFVFLFVFWRCRRRRRKVEHLEAVSITSASSKDLLLYGTPQKDVGTPSNPAEPTQLLHSEKMNGRPEQDRRLSFASTRDSSMDTDPATSFLHRRQSTSSVEAAKIGTIQPDLYRRKGSVVTHRSNSARIGRVRLRLQYNFGKSDFLVTCLETAGMENPVSEFFFKVALKPGVDVKARKTSPRKKSANFEFEEQEMKFPLTYEELLDQTLLIQMLDSGRFSRVPVLVGEVSLDMADLDPSERMEVWADIVSKSDSENYGEVLCSLTYLRAVERLTVTIHEARELKKMDIGGSSDPYVKVLLCQSGKLLKKRNSSVRKNSVNPVWNEAVNFNIPDKALSKSSLELIVKDYDLVGHNETIGRVVLSSESGDARARHTWEELLQLKTTPPTWLTLHFFQEDKLRKGSSDTG